MAPRSKTKAGKKNIASRGGDASVAKMVNWEDTIEDGGEDTFHVNRDKVLFEDTSNERARRFQPLADDDAFNDEEDVFAGKGFAGSEDEDDDDDSNEIYYDGEEHPDTSEVVPRARKAKAKADSTPKGRYAKPEPTSSDEDELSDGSDEDDSDSGRSDQIGGGDDSEDEDETWGANPSAYYARPSTRRAREGSDSGDEDLEERRAMEEREAKVLQRKMREGMGRGDFGIDEGFTLADDDAEEEGEKQVESDVPLPTDPAALLRHLELTNPLTLALAREWADLADRLPRVTEAFNNQSKDDPDHPALGMSALHCQTLITYATTLAFYIHLASLPKTSRPDLSSHPVMTRLLQLKEALGELESQDFAGDEDDDDDDDLAIADREMAEFDYGDDDDEEEEEGDSEEDDDELTEEQLIQFGLLGKGAGQDEMAWRKEMLANMEEDELAELMGDLEELKTKSSSSASKKKSSMKEKATPVESTKKTKKQKVSKDLPFPTLEEPSPVFSTSTIPSSKKSKSSRSTPSSSSSTAFLSSRSAGEDDAHLEPTTLGLADSSAKEAARHSLRFHTSKIESASNRRANARQGRMGGDDDVPYRDRKAGRDAALRKSTAASLGGADGDDMDLDGEEWGEGDRKRAREVREDYDPGEADEGDDGYYELVKKRKRDHKEDKQVAYDEAREAERFVEDDSSTGPRTLTRAILKNKGLTPHRNKSVRNPRVKKKLQYEKAKKKVSSIQAVYKGGQGALKGDYGGEQTGISTVIKSRKF
ncbi:Disrupter of silencing SAS10 [Phaffia rhodozyma]|uniref:Disrupter of silencing SAS10 n=1 Tax=Phaffia rhodozyma TaxID=264483 RepID=A0A0F7SM45_PHARH|nr:Disrupter of silencing SAS10 [Phaffia rhodozyma]